MAENADQEPKVENAKPASEMKAITLSGFGGIKMLKVQKVPEVTPADGEVLIRVKAA
jgi:D-arabinose 1-dehydrogenase-like Zn-dependent alcohol dehydrogenase